MLTPHQNMIYMIAAFIILMLCITIIVVGIIVVHDIPYKVASRRNNPQKDAIRCMSILGLIAFPLWLLSMIWAYMRTCPESTLPLNICNNTAKKEKSDSSIEKPKKCTEKYLRKSEPTAKDRTEYKPRRNTKRNYKPRTQKPTNQQ